MLKMISLSRFLTAATVLLLTTGWMRGQTLTTNFIPATIQAPVGQTVDIQLKVNGFTNILTCQFPITFNTAVLQYQSASDFSLPGFGQANVSYQALPTPRIGISYEAHPINFPTGVTVAPGTSLVTLRFKVIGEGVSNINISKQPGLQPVVDIIQDPGNEVTLNFQGGGSTVTGGSGVAPEVYYGFHIIAGSDTVNTGSNFCIPIKVNDFEAIESFQFAIHYDKTKLTYTGVQNIGLVGFDPSTSLNVNTSTGLAQVNWADPGELVNGQWVIDGVTMADKATMFEMCFNAIGTPGASTQITIDGVGLFSGPAEAINHNGQQLWKDTTGIPGTIYFASAPPPNAIQISIDTATVLTGEIKCLDVKVKNFTAMDQVQLGIAYDPTKLEFVSVNGIPGPLNLSQGSTIVYPPTSAVGQIKLSWYDISPTGVGTTLPDGTTIFSICFKGIGAPGMTSKVEFKNLPGANGTSFDIEVFKNGSTVPVTPNLKNGHLYITNVPPCSANVQLAAQTNPKCFNANSGAIDITATGSGTLSYSWTGPNSFTASTADLNNVRAGTYIGTVTSTAGCSATISVTLLNPAQLTASGTGTGVTCFGGANGSIALTAGGGTGALTYAWSGPSNPPAVQNPSNLAAGNYSVTVTDANQCSQTAGPILVPTPGPINIINVATQQPTCFNSNNGSVSLGADGGTPPFTYNWSGPGLPNPSNGTSISNLGAGVFQVTVSDSKGCQKISQTFAMQPPAELKVSVDAVGNVKCFDDANGTISITTTGGTPNYSFEWKNSSGVIASTQEDPTLPAGVYTVVVKDNKNCTASTASVTIASPSSALTVAAPTTNNVTCPGGSDGSISLSINGGWGSPSVQWNSPAATGTNPTNLPAGNYSATITDSQGCSKTQTAQITAPPAIELTNTTVNNLKCHNSADGSISINVTGGNAPLNVVWMPGGLVGTTISQLSPGNYTPSITDGKQCTKVFASINVNAPTQVVADQQNVVDADGSNNGSITVEISGGTKPYKYVWSNGAPDSKTMSAPAGTYTVTVTDANGCVLVLTNVIGQKSVAFAPTFVSAVPTCFGEINGCITVNLNTAHTPHLPVTITWQGGSQVANAFGDFQICDLAGGTYNLTLTASTGQVATLTNLNVLQHPLVQHQINSKNPNEDFKNGEIKLNPIWTAAGYSYQWEWFENGTLKTATTKDLIDLDSGTYCVTITNIATNCKINFCERLDRVWQPISVSSAPEVENPTCVNSCNGSIRVFYSGGRPPFHYKWTSSLGGTFPDTNRIVNLCAATYNLTVTDENGTTKTASWTLKPKSTIAATATVTPGPNGYDVSGPKECDGEVKISTTGQSGALTYQWSNAATTATNSTLCKGAWWAIVTDGVGCADTLNGSLTAPPAVVFGVNISNFNGFNVRCAGGSDGEAAVTISGGVPPYEVEWSTGFNQTINTASGITHQKALAAGTYFLTVTDANDVKNIDTITLVEPEPFVIDIVEKKPSRFTECDGTMELKANGAAPISFSWTSQIDADTTATVGDLCANELVNILAIDANQCRATVSERMDYPDDGCLIFRPVLTPGQSEEKNDDLFVTCIESVPENSLEIYNRWGQLVYQTDAYDNAGKVWKGTNSKNQPLPEGVYYYILNYKNSRDEQQQVKGYVNLLR